MARVLKTALLPVQHLTLDFHIHLNSHALRKMAMMKGRVPVLAIMVEISGWQEKDSFQVVA